MRPRRDKGYHDDEAVDASTIRGRPLHRGKGMPAWRMRYEARRRPWTRRRLSSSRCPGRTSRDAAARLLRGEDPMTASDDICVRDGAAKAFVPLIWWTPVDRHREEALLRHAAGQSDPGQSWASRLQRPHGGALPRRLNILPGAHHPTHSVTWFECRCGRVLGSSPGVLGRTHAEPASRLVAPSACCNAAKGGGPAPHPPGNVPFEEKAEFL